MRRPASRRRQDEELIQLATRLPKRLLFDVKIYCVRHDRPIMDFVREALTEHLARVSGRRGSRGRG